MVAELSVVTVVVANSSTAYGGGASPTPYRVTTPWCCCSASRGRGVLGADPGGARRRPQRPPRGGARVLRHRATHDLLTGLPNPGGARRRAPGRARPGRPAGRTRGRTRRGVAGLRHRPLQDRHHIHGHAAGDAFLVEVADRLQTSVRDGDLVAGSAGDEFVVLVRVADEASVGAVCDRIMARVGGRPVVVPVGDLVAGGGAVHVGGRGAQRCRRDRRVAVPRSTRPSTRRERLAADGWSTSTTAAGRVRDEGDIERGLPPPSTGDEIRVLHEPMLELATGKVVGFESATGGSTRSGGCRPRPVRPHRRGGRPHRRLFAAVLAKNLDTQRRWTGRSASPRRSRSGSPGRTAGRPVAAGDLSLGADPDRRARPGAVLEVSESATLDASRPDATWPPARPWRAPDHRGLRHRPVLGRPGGGAPLGPAPDRPGLRGRLTVEPDGPGWWTPRHHGAHPRPAPWRPGSTHRAAGPADELALDIVGGFVVGGPVPASQAAALVGADGRWTGHRRGAADSSP